MSELTLMQKKYSLWKQGLCWLLLLGPFFFLSYGQVNLYTATRSDIGSIVFNWERAIPFMPWTIVPYWSIDLLYGISLFICTSKQELTRHGCRLLAGSFIACVGFLLFPLKFTFIRPDIQGMFGWLFYQLELFDLPFNQAPSLHIILTWLLWLRFRQHLTRSARLVNGAWFLLIALSVLTTWQHHFIDVFSGFIVAMAISYAIPIKDRWQWKVPSSHELCLAAKYFLSSLICLIIGMLIPYGYFLFWPAVALFIVASGYAGLGISVFQKSSGGYLSLSARFILYPYLIGAWFSKQWFSHSLAKTSLIYDGISLGGFPDKTPKQEAVLDLTAEFHRSYGMRRAWCAHPLMDLTVPDIGNISHAVAKLTELKKKHHTVLVCCALGLSRSATVMAAWLVAERHVSSVAQAIDHIKKQRPQVVLTSDHIQLLEHFQEIQCKTSG
ncbi:phosphatase PAP2/dual specificity phosphatase family protein [Candidatus Pantoea floridensis]|uniref:PAP2 superfamily protein n=1 Tax=Candidatus Pantoea floridensis TaxID=1938870 RepID=A0A286BYE7_9GAMM|nr:phosphatase PAP2/dual specificity phosphatase family protein [Pantoea floridensis]PIF21663.1 PAP2 superfamily protein [Enterobacteriaceae bacterium JKS000233]SOD39174.1 PAP2 superfamily protein [Pantoea floridensis]